MRIQTSGRFFQIKVAFSENLNFTFVFKLKIDKRKPIYVCVKGLLSQIFDRSLKQQQSLNCPNDF